MGFAARLDDFGRPAWVALTVLGFVLYWPVGLAVLAFSAWSGRMGCWHHSERWQERAERWREHVRDHAQRKAERWRRHDQERHSSGNRAFDEYRADTLRRLEDEQREFMEFLERLRMAKDKAEFDDFLSARRRGASEGPEAASPPA